MERLINQRRRWNTLGFVVSIVIFIIIIGLIYYAHQFNRILTIILHVLLGICIAITIFIVFKRNRNLSKKGNF